MRTELARAHLLYGEWLRRRKRRRDAQLQLRRAHDMFSAMGAAAFADRTGIEQRASGCASRDGPRPPNPFGLTPQETQVARRAVTGRRHGVAAGCSSPSRPWNTTSATSSGNWASHRAANWATPCPTHRHRRRADACRSPRKQRCASLTDMRADGERHPRLRPSVNRRTERPPRRRPRPRPLAPPATHGSARGIATVTAERPRAPSTVQAIVSTAVASSALTCRSAR